MISTTDTQVSMDLLVLSLNNLESLFQVPNRIYYILIILPALFSLYLILYTKVSKISWGQTASNSKTVLFSAMW